MSKLFLFHCINCQNTEWADNSLVLLSCKELLFAIEFLLIFLCYNDFSNIVAWKENEKKAKKGRGWGKGDCRFPRPRPTCTSYWQVLLTLDDAVADYLIYKSVKYLAPSSTWLHHLSLLFPADLLVSVIFGLGILLLHSWIGQRDGEGAEVGCDAPHLPGQVFVSVICTYTEGENEDVSLQHHCCAFI